MGSIKTSEKRIARPQIDRIGQRRPKEMPRLTGCMKNIEKAITIPKIQKIYYWVIAGKVSLFRIKASSKHRVRQSAVPVYFCCEAFPVCTLPAFHSARVLFMPRYLAGNPLKAASKIAIVVLGAVSGICCNP